MHLVNDAFGMLWKAVFFYILLVALLRVMGKRQIGSLSAIDLVVVIMISEAAIISVENKEIPIWVGVVPVLALAGMELLSSWLTLKSPGLRSFVEGRPSIVIEKGRVNQRELASLRFDLNDLLAQIRVQGYPNVAEIEYAILETNGKLSVIPKATARPATTADVGVDKKATPQEIPLNLIDDGKILEESLRLVGKDEDWLRGILRKQGIDDPREVFLASLDNQGRLFLQKQAPGRRGEAPKPKILQLSNGSSKGGVSNG